MLIRIAPNIKPSEITDKGIYLKRREFIKTAAALSAAAVAGCGPDSPPPLTDLSSRLSAAVRFRPAKN